MMLSRLLPRTGAARALTLVRPVSTSPAVKAAVDLHGAEVDIFENEKNPERDLVNFPRRSQKIQPDPVRHWWIPEEYFTFFHPKTGVTGPYMFVASFGTFMVSKEIFPISHDVYTGAAMATLFAFLCHQLSPAATAFTHKAVDDQVAELSSIRNNEIDRCKVAVEDENSAQFMSGSYEELIAAKKENVALQMESEYRARLKDAYSQVKSRLDYQLQTANVIRNNEQKHMVNWIISNVKASITAKQEEDALKKCVADLKAMATAK